MKWAAHDKPTPKEPEMYFDNGGADTNGLFPPYQASPEAIESSAGELDRHGTSIEAFSKDIDEQHQVALARVSGVLSDPMATATQPSTPYSLKLMGSTYVSSGSIRLFGQGVQAFNQKIARLNEQFRQAAASDFGVAEASYPDKATFAQVTEADEARSDKIMDARVALLRTLVEQYRDAIDKLDEEAEAGAARINAGPTDQVLQNLYAAGALPSSVETAFPDIAFVAGALPADADEMSDVELADYLRAHPELLGNKQAMAEVAERIENLTMEDGEASGRTLRDALSGKASMTDVEEELALLSLVGMYGSYAQSHGQALPKGATQYVRGLFTDLVHSGAEDRTMDVLDWITAREHEIEVKMPPEGGAPGGPLETQTRTVPGFDQATQDWMKQAYADGILLMSDSTTNGLGRDYISPDVEAALNDVIRLETSVPAEGAGNSRTAISLVGGDGFAKLADLLGHSSEGIQPSLTLAQELTESSAETAEVINTGLQNIPSDSDINYLGTQEALDRFGPLLEQSVDVAARNVGANQALLTEAGSNGHSPAAEQLRELYTFEWPDNGRAVSQYTDWIADYSVPDDNSEAELTKVEQAEQASVGFINFVTDAQGSSNNFKALMQFTNDGQTRSFGDVNPELAKAFGLVTASNLDALGGSESGKDTTTESFNESISVGDSDRHRLFTLVGTSDSAAQNLGSTIGAYEQDQLDRALMMEDPEDRVAALQAARDQAARLDGFLAGGMLNARMIESDGAYQDDKAAYNEAMTYVTAGKAVVTGGLSYVPGAGGISAATGLFFDGIGKSIDVPEVPPGIDASKPASDGYVEGVATWDYAMALDRSNVAMPAELEGVLEKIRDTYGARPTHGDLGQPELDAIKDALAGDPLYKEYIDNHLGAAPFNDTAINDEGTHSQDAVRDFLEGRKG